MRLDDCYRLLEINPRASAEEVKRAHRDLTKVWHPDRFGDDGALRRKAEEKLKAINEAFETIRGWRPERAQDASFASGVRSRRRETGRPAVYALLYAAVAILILLRRPSPAGLVIALVLFVVAFVFIARARR